MVRRCALTEAEVYRSKTSPDYANEKYNYAMIPCLIISRCPLRSVQRGWARPCTNIATCHQDAVLVIKAHISAYIQTTRTIHKLRPQVGGLIIYMQGRIRATGGKAFQAHASGFDPRVAFDVDGQSESMQHEKMPALPFIKALNRISLIRYVFIAEVLSTQYQFHRYCHL